VFFFEKKNQKTFVYFGQHRIHLIGSAAASMSKSFLVPFFKKEQLPSWRPAR
jgi:hypothetical protein